MGKRQVRKAARGYDVVISTYPLGCHATGALRKQGKLAIPAVGFLSGDDPRVLATIEQVERRLLDQGFVRRYDTDQGADGLPPGEGAFLPCTFWYADALVLAGRRAEARAVFDRMLALRNDVGLLSEEVDPSTSRLLGNFPQAWSHVTLVNTATLLS